MKSHPAAIGPMWCDADMAVHARRVKCTTVVYRRYSSTTEYKALWHLGQLHPVVTDSWVPGRHALMDSSQLDIHIVKKPSAASQSYSLGQAPSTTLLLIGRL